MSSSKKRKRKDPVSNSDSDREERRKKKKSKREKKRKRKSEKSAAASLSETKTIKKVKKKKQKTSDNNSDNEKEKDQGSSCKSVEDDTKRNSMRPMTKEEWEKRQSVVRRVYDESTGRSRLIKGDGEVLEEIVSKSRHQEINRQATAGDGSWFQSRLGLNPK